MNPSHNAQDVRIVPARPEDAGVLLDLIRGLAEYEKLTHALTADEERVRSSLFGSPRAAEALLAWTGDEPVGFAVFFHNYSTFLARPGLYLEDLFVRPEWRGKGVGKRLLARVARVAAERGCGRMEWSVLDWNVDAIGFYRTLGAQAMDEWTTFRLQGDSLARLAALDRG